MHGAKSVYDSPVVYLSQDRASVMKRVIVYIRLGAKSSSQSSRGLST